jgi:hypothetical protein
MTKIIGICLIKNEDLFIEYAIRNCIDFCDEILILDNKSIDNTFNIITNLKSEYSKIRIISVNNCKDTNKYINKYAGTDTWIFGVDGDEIYDKSGLSNIRKLILDGKFNNYYRIRASTIHVFNLDIEKNQATGYMSPPARHISKLYNFNHLITNFPVDERLHGEVKWNNDNIYIYSNFNEDNFRCLHLCFINRSSVNRTIKYTKNNNQLFITNPPNNQINEKFVNYTKNDIIDTVDTSKFINKL